MEADAFVSLRHFDWLVEEFRTLWVIGEWCSFPFEMVSLVIAKQVGEIGVRMQPLEEQLRSHSVRRLQGSEEPKRRPWGWFDSVLEIYTAASSVADSFLESFA